MLGMGMLSYPNIVATYGRGYTGFAPSYSYQFPVLTQSAGSLMGVKMGGVQSGGEQLYLSAATVAPRRIPAISCLI
ncbi:RNA-binding protein Musashi 2 [Liparis tanakae]|uniref:RNA-binding protein Musashi 2 n=1 Tax=Liparis tanakae TaxID=230148 RepID=A0A4Z2JBX9_9TELE|nr:RNA-binding protein Musashi 2 [Liparis tanakae]